VVGAEFRGRVHEGSFGVLGPKFKRVFLVGVSGSGNEFGVCRNKLFFGSGYHHKLDDIQLGEYSLTLYHRKKEELRRGQVGRHGEAPSISSASSLGLD